MYDLENRRLGLIGKAETTTGNTMMHFLGLAEFNVQEMHYLEYGVLGAIALVIAICAFCLFCKCLKLHIAKKRDEMLAAKDIVIDTDELEEEGYQGDFS